MTTDGTNTTKMLQMVLDGQVSIRNDVKKLDEKLTGMIDDAKTSLTFRIDNIGRQVANIDDDAPSGEEFANLEERVKILEANFATN